MMPNLRLYALLLLAVACSENKFDVSNSSPVAVIMSLSDGESVEAGEVTVTGSVSDPDDRTEVLMASWWVDDERVCDDAEPTDLRQARLRSIENHAALMTTMGIDIWLCPATTSLAPRGLESTGDPTMNLPWTYLGLPVLTLPTLPASGGLWHGLQIVGRYYRDEALLSFARLISPLFTAVGADDMRASGELAVHHGDGGLHRNP